MMISGEVKRDEMIQQERVRADTGELQGTSRQRKRP